jgi:hypothetical protein
MNVLPFPSAERRHLRLVPPAPAPRRRLEVRVHVLDGHAAFGRSRAFRIAESNVLRLIDHALRLESLA